MKIYYIGAISLLDRYGISFENIKRILKNTGNNVNDSNFLGWQVSNLDRTDDYRKDHYKKVVKDIKSSDLIVSEVSFPSSINVGHEITLAMEYDKPVLALYSKGNSPIFLEGNTSSKFILAEYDPEDKEGLERMISRNIKKLMKSTDIRFNFFISPEIARYLDWLNKYKRIPRSVYLRDLIENEMESNEEYKEFKAS